MKRRTIVAAVVVAAFVAAGLLAPSKTQAQMGAGVAFTCSADDIGATLTLLTGCRAPETGLRRYITGVVAQSTTSTSGQFILRYGTSVHAGGSANCATGTTSVLPSAATAARITAPDNAAAPTSLTFVTPISIPKETDLCVLGVATNTTTIQVVGYVAP